MVPTSAPVTTVPTETPSTAPTLSPTSAPSRSPTLVPTPVPTLEPTNAPVRAASNIAADTCLGYGDGFFACAACTQDMLGIVSDSAGFEGCACRGHVEFDTGAGSVEVLSFCFPRDGFMTSDPTIAPPVACSPPSDRCRGPSNTTDVIVFFAAAYLKRGHAITQRGNSSIAVPPLDAAAVWQEYVNGVNGGSAANGRAAGAMCAPWARGKMCSSCASGHFRDTGGACTKCTSTDPVHALGVPALVFFLVGLSVFITAVVVIGALLFCKNALRRAFEHCVSTASESHDDDTAGGGLLADVSDAKLSLRSLFVRFFPHPMRAAKDAAQLSLWSVLQLQLVATTASAFAGRAPEWMLWFYSALRIALFVIPNTNSACVSEMEKTLPFVKEEGLFTITLCVLLVSAALSVKIFRIESWLRCCSSDAAESGKRFFTDAITPYLRLATFMYLNIGYAYITMTALGSVDCISLKSNGGVREQSSGTGLWLEQRPETRCWAAGSGGGGDAAHVPLGAEHMPLGVLALLVLVFYSVGYPVTSFVFIYFQFFHNTDDTERHGVLQRDDDDDDAKNDPSDGGGVVGGTRGEIELANFGMMRALAGRRAVGDADTPATLQMNPLTLLPGGWDEHLDVASGKQYFVHTTGVTQWTRPSMTAAVAWSVKTDIGSGHFYFVCASTGATSWELPLNGRIVSEESQDLGATQGEASGEIKKAATKAVSSEDGSDDDDADAEAATAELKRSRSKLMRSMTQLGLVRDKAPHSAPLPSPLLSAPTSMFVPNAAHSIATLKSGFARELGDVSGDVIYFFLITL